jgi:hypothetical protein
VSIPELNMVIHIIADSLNQRPSLGDVAELRPGEGHKKVGLAVTATQQINQRLDWQPF